MNSNKVIVGTGLLGLDVIFANDGQFIRATLGGSCGNVLGILAEMGWNSYPVNVIGHDRAGDILLTEMRQIGMQSDFVSRSPSHRTPVIYQHQQGKEQKHFAKPTHKFSFECPICGEKHKPDFNYDPALGSHCACSLPDADAFFLDRPTKLGLSLAKLYRSKGALIIFEPSSMNDSPNLFQEILKHTNILKYADDRISELKGYDLSHVSLEIQTSGARGLSYRAPSLRQQWVKLDAYQVPFVSDTAGAGDWCTAGMIYKLLEEKEAGMVFSTNHLEEAISFGQLLSALNCTTTGARGLTSILDGVELRRLAASYTYTERGQANEFLYDNNPLDGKWNSRVSKHSAPETMPAVCCS